MDSHLSLSFDREYPFPFSPVAVLQKREKVTGYVTEEISARHKSATYGAGRL